MADKVMIFIDGGNLYHGAKKNNIKIDFNKLRNLLINHDKIHGRLERAYYYGAKRIPHNPKEIAFYEMLQDIGYTTRIRNLKELPNGRFVEKGVDNEAINDMLMLAFNNAYNTAVIISGDQDFIGTINNLKLLGLKIVVCSFKNQMSRELRLEADDYIYLDDFGEEINYS